jgi:hypothetical protein
VLTHVIEVQVAQVNQAPQVMPMPVQLVREGETLGFTVSSFDADGDATQLRLVRDADTPADVFFNAATGAFEWTPGLGTMVSRPHCPHTISLPTRLVFRRIIALC